MKLLLCLVPLIVASGVVHIQPVTANEIIKKACSEAAQQNKKALVIFHASWCVWCHRLDSSMNDPSCAKYFADHFVVEHVTVLEVDDKEGLNNPGGKEFLSQHHALDQGIPAWFIFDKDGNLLADSQKRPPGASFDTEGENIGCPANEQEVDYFINVLKKLSPLGTEDEQAIRARFLKNKAHLE